MRILASEPLIRCSLWCNLTAIAHRLKLGSVDETPTGEAGAIFPYADKYCVMKLNEVLNEELHWTERDKDLYMSLKGLINKNNGVFKSQKQQAYLLKVIKPDAEGRDPGFVKSNFGVDLNDGEKFVYLDAMAQWANYGSRSVVPVRYGFIVDDIGVVRFYKIGNKGNLRGGAHPDASKTKLEWERPAKVDASHLELTQAQKDAEEAKKKREFLVKMGGSVGNYIGHVGDKKFDLGEVELVTSKVVPGYKGPVTWQMFKNANGDFIYYTGNDLGLQPGKKVHLMGTIARHVVSKKGDKTTVIHRPKIL